MTTDSAHPPERWRQFIRLVTGVGVVMSINAVIVTTWVGARTGPYILAGTAIAFAALGMMNHRGWSQAVIANGLAIIGWATSCLLCVFAGGGIEAPAVILLPAVPAMAGIAAGARTASAWTVVVLLTAIVIYATDPYIDPHEASQEAVQRLQLIGILGTAVFIGISVVSYKRTETRQRSQLEAAIDAAETARQAAETARSQAETARSQAETARSQAEAARNQAELANRAKGSFLTTMSHEIRTPLTAVVGVAEVLRNAGLDGQHTRQLELLDGAGRTLLGLIDDILDLSRIESGELELEAIALDLFALVDEVSGVLHTHAATRGVQLLSSHPGALPVRGDPLRLRQILLNLVGNAVKFTEDGEVEVRCEAVPSSEDAHFDVTLTVRDTGVGIAREHLALVFQPFTQAEQGTARRFGGSGLGLSIVGRLVGMMGGEIGIESELHQGTTITVQLTMPCAPELPPRRSSPASHRPRPLRVLLAEDNPVNQEVVSFMLEQCNCTVSLAENGEEAIEAIQQATPPFDMVLMDCQMPHVDGFTATRRLREKGCALPVIALTANATPSIRARCLEAGMTGFASKPVTLEELRSVLTLHAPTEVPGLSRTPGAT